MTVSIHENAWVAWAASVVLHQQKVAIAIGNNIYLWNTAREAFLCNEKWVRHEFVHVLQFRRHGFIRFLCLYVWEWLKNGYRNNKFEVEARMLENDGYILQRVLFN